MDKAEFEALQKRLTPGKLVKATDIWDVNDFHVGIIDRVERCCFHDDGGTDMARVRIATLDSDPLFYDTDEYRFTAWGEE